MKNIFDCSGYSFTRFWHCFGNSNHLASLDDVIGMLEASRTNVLPINTHRLDSSRNEDALEVGYAGVSVNFLAQHYDISRYHKMLNINLQTTAEDAVEKTKIAYDLLGEPLIKLEVLDSTHTYSNQEEIVKATKMLNNWDAKLEVFPLFENDLDVAKQLIDAGSKLVRVMGSGIGTCGGIKDIDTFQRICELGVPVILDGGIGHIQDAKLAMEAGATGILINSMLFKKKDGPVPVMTQFSNDYHNLLASNYSASESVV